MTMNPVTPAALSANAKCRMCGNPAPDAAACDECIAKVDRQSEIKNHSNELAREGLYSLESQAVRFAVSNPTIEAQNQKAWDALRAYRAKENLYIAGAMGTGKTHAAQCILTRAKDSLWRVAEMSILNLFEAHRSFDKAHYKAFVYTRMLLIDDIDKCAQWTPQRLECLWQTLDLRNQRRYRTIITSNSKPGTLRQIMQEQSGNPGLVAATLDRLNPIQIVELSGASNRTRTTT